MITENSSSRKKRVILHKLKYCPKCGEDKDGIVKFTAVKTPWTYITSCHRCGLGYRIEQL